jgi:TonB-dependent receptor
LAARYTPRDSIRLNAIASMADSHSFYSDDRIYFPIYNTIVHYDPTLNHKFPEVMTTTSMTDVSRFATPMVDANFYREGDRVITGKVNGSDSFATGLAPFDRITVEAGISWVSSQKASDRKSNGAAVRADAQYRGTSFVSLDPAVYMRPGLPVTNFLDGIAHGRRIMSWATAPRAFYQALDMNGILARQPSVYSGVFNVTEAVEAAYVQFDTNGKLFGHGLRVNAGLRYAVTRLWGYNYNSTTGASGQVVYSKAHLSNSYDTLLPSFSIAYDATEDVVLRAVYGKTITRPSLGNIAQGTTIPVRFNPVAASGNPELLPLHAQNIDIGAEWYFMPDALLSGGIYYKSLKNLISIQTTTVPFNALNLPWSSLDPSVFGTTPIPSLAMQLSHPVNLNPMVVKGFEVFYQQSYGFLPPPFDGVGSLLSFTYTAGAAGGPGTGFVANDGSVYKKQITGMSTYTFSGTAFYEKGPYNVRMSYSWHSATPFEDGNHDGTDLRLWNQARGSLDATLAYEFDEFLELRLDGTNLLNAAEYQYATDGTKGHTGYTVDWHKNQNRVIYDYLHGTTFVVSLRGRL